MSNNEYYKRRKHYKCKKHCKPSPCAKKCDCKIICGEIFLKQDRKCVTILGGDLCSINNTTIIIHNLASSVADMKVMVCIDKCYLVEYVVPPGNTVTQVLDDVTQIFVEQVGRNHVKGEYELKICPIHK